MTTAIDDRIPPKAETSSFVPAVAVDKKKWRTGGALRNPNSLEALRKANEEKKRKADGLGNIPTVKNLTVKKLNANNLNVKILNSICRKVSISRLNADEFTITSYAHARRLLGLITLATSKGKITHQQGSTLAGLIRIAMDALERESQHPDNAGLAAKFEVVIDRSGATIKSSGNVEGEVRVELDQ